MINEANNEDEESVFEMKMVTQINQVEEICESMDLCQMMDATPKKVKKR